MACWLPRTFNPIRRWRPDQNDVDFFWRVAPALRRLPARRPNAPPPHQVPAPASTRINCLPVFIRKPVSSSIQHVRFYVERLYNTVFIPLPSVRSASADRIRRYHRIGR